MIFKNITVDSVIFCFLQKKLKVLLWKVEPARLKRFLADPVEYALLLKRIDNNPAYMSVTLWGLASTDLKDTHEKQEHVAHRAAKQYSFSTGTYQMMIEAGLKFNR